MKAVVIDGFGSVDAVHIEDFEVPHPNKGEVQIEVVSAGVNPVDWKIREGYLRDYLDHDFPIILGWDVAGIVNEVTEGVTHLKKGDAVYAYCRRPKIHWGTFAEFVTFDADHVAHKPESLSFAQAAAVPLSGLTAWQSLFEFLEIKEGDTILIHAGAGGVGSFAIPLAKLVGAYVVTTASPRNHEYVKMLGADEVIDYNRYDFVEKVLARFPEGVDHVYDCVGGKTYWRSFDCVKRGGNVVTICRFDEEKVDPETGIRSGHVFVRPDGEQLMDLAELFDDGSLPVPEIHLYPFESVSDALLKSREGHTRGKIVLSVQNEEDL